MVRRLVLEEPPSRLAIWSRRLALFSLAVALLAVILVRGGFVEALPGVAVLGAAICPWRVRRHLDAWFSRTGPRRVSTADRHRTGRLSGLSRCARLSVAGDLRHHDRSGRPAALRGDRPFTAARRQSGCLSRAGRGAEAACGISRHRAAAAECLAAGSL